MELATRAVSDDGEDPPPTSTLSFSFVIDASGRIVQIQSDSALRELGWDEGLVGRSCYATVACRDLSGASLCDTCLAARAGRPGGPPWRRPIARMRATAGEVLAQSSRVRRLLRRRLIVEVTV